MDRTDDFRTLLTTHNNITVVPQLSNPFILKSIDLISRLRIFEQYILSIFDQYVNYHRYLSPSRSFHKQDSRKYHMTEYQRDQIRKDITTTITNIGKEIQYLQKYEIQINDTVVNDTKMSLDDTALKTMTVGIKQHYKEIIQYLLERLNYVTRITQDMNKKYYKINHMNGHPLLSSFMFSKKLSDSMMMSSSTISSMTRTSLNNTTIGSTTQDFNDSPLTQDNVLHTVDSIKVDNSDMNEYNHIKDDTIYIQQRKDKQDDDENKTADKNIHIGGNEYKSSLDRLSSSMTTTTTTNPSSTGLYDKSISTVISNEIRKEDSKNVPSTIVSTDFATRYEDEIASTHLLTQYKHIGNKHRQLLLKEAKSLQTQYTKELIESEKIESSIYQISSLLTEFTTVLQNQDGLVEHVYETAVAATDFVTDTNKELLLTIERTQNHSRNMMILAVFLGVLLLLLDYLTP